MNTKGRINEHLLLAERDLENETSINFHNCGSNKIGTKEQILRPLLTVLTLGLYCRLLWNFAVSFLVKRGNHSEV